MLQWCSELNVAKLITLIPPMPSRVLLCHRSMFCLSSIRGHSINSPSHNDMAKVKVKALIRRSTKSFLECHGSLSVPQSIRFSSSAQPF
ncbi:unnamed protein product [Fusarium graminearum]|uniref:Chromosome 4, complete genome n=3 Tax=Gibberella zeae TaxID=5518 RepID=A0A098DQE1_GIBZE|nr:unnamed protein product [Fusarium graminearum]CAF3642588.1 unnamed protein product [Fusarium graminearum]CAG1965443.1 unnamed protein product [Fusarium graminearum]CAG1993046.1 unnamed protein product [Fusarium graminearum]CEF84075.1 unnamed protein product [Fusarium graminearum]